MVTDRQYVLIRRVVSAILLSNSTFFHRFFLFLHRCVLIHLLSRVAPLFHWVASNLGQVVYTHIASPVSQLQETGVQKGVFGA